jgi:hypothetical protein
VSVFKAKTPELPPLASADEIILELEEQLNRARLLVAALKERSKEVERDDT